MGLEKQGAQRKEVFHKWDEADLLPDFNEQQSQHLERPYTIPRAANEPGLANFDVVGSKTTRENITGDAELINDLSGELELADKQNDFVDTVPANIDDTFNRLANGTREENLASVITPYGGASGAGGATPGDIRDAQVVVNKPITSSAATGKGTGYSLRSIKEEQVKNNSFKSRIKNLFGL